jgi:predicted nucleic-acid-binding Zn-ribbon protein
METGVRFVTVICKDCGSDRIGFDAWVDKDGNVIGGPYDNSLCMDCGCEEIVEEEVLTSQ